MTNGHVVLLAYYFPPLVGVASERAASMTVHLRDLGWSPVVISASDGFYHRTSDAVIPAVPVVRTTNLELSRMLRRTYAIASDAAESDATTVQAVETGGLGERARRLVRELAYVPDAQVGWIPFASVAATRTLRRTDSPRVLFSTSVPYSAHLAAMWAARRSDTPWVAEFRDPWSTGGWSTPSRPRQRLDRDLESRVLRSADHVVVTSEATRLELLGAYPELPPEGISVVTNGFEPMPVSEPPPSAEPMTILYAGTVAAGEDMAPILDALDRVNSRDPGAFRLRVLGPEDAWNSALESASRPPWLQLEGVVSPQAAREAMAESSVLLLVRRHPAYRLVMPGKAFEYIGARRPILAVVPPGSEMESLIRDHADARLVSPDKADALDDAVERLLAEHRAGRIQEPRVPLSAIAPLQRSEQAKKLAAVFAKVAR